MFNSFPAVFKNKKAAQKAADAFSIETKEQWTILCKMVENKKWYKPCQVKDYNYKVKSDGWFIHE